MSWENTSFGGHRRPSCTKRRSLNLWSCTCALPQTKEACIAPSRRRVCLLKVCLGLVRLSESEFHRSQRCWDVWQRKKGEGEGRQAGTGPSAPSMTPRIIPLFWLFNLGACSAITQDASV
eukprot:751156-Hanusia_phi.AAC.2